MNHKEQGRKKVQPKMQGQENDQEVFIPMFPIKDVADQQQSTGMLEQMNSQQTKQQQNKQQNSNDFNQIVSTCPVCKKKQYRSL